MLVIVDWTELGGDGHSLWHVQLCLYAYLHPVRDWLLYVGKADFATVHSRLMGGHKAALLQDIFKHYGIDTVRVLHGHLAPSDGRRRTSELLADVESLLIYRLQPFGNIQARRSRISRPGLRVECQGDWPFKRFRFRDE